MNEVNRLRSLLSGFISAYRELVALGEDLSDEEYEVFAYDNNVDLEDANEMEEFIWTLSEEDAKKIIKQLRGSYKKGGKTRKNRKK